MGTAARGCPAGQCPGSAWDGTGAINSFVEGRDFAGWRKMLDSYQGIASAMP